MFIDDILVYCMSEEDLEAYLCTMLKLLKEKLLYNKYSKCKFWLYLVSLGHMVSRKGFMVDPQKVKAAKNRSILMNVIIFCSFMGLTSYSHRFVKGFPALLLS